MKYYFPDTNIFIHHLNLDQGNWKEVFSEEEIEIIVAPSVINELDELKYSAKDSKIRQRAVDQAKLLLKWGDSKKISDKIRIRLYEKPILTDFAKNLLSRESKDDLILATVIQFISETKDQAVVLTADTGLLLKCRSRKIASCLAPESLRLPLEKDENAALRQRIKALENKFSDLFVQFLDGNQFIKIKAESPKLLTDGERVQKINRNQAEYPPYL